MPPPLRPVRHELRFLLPPSLGAEAAHERGERLAAFLTRAADRPVEVSVASAYDALARDLLAGRVDAAWAPPFVCARVESMGARVVVRGVRDGVSVYRAALVCREDGPAHLEGLSGTRAVWVDEDLVAGYLLPLALLRARGMNPSKTFFSQTFAGSYRAALAAVAEGRADVTSAFAPARREARPDVTAIPEIAPEWASRFRVLAFTEEAPNDGVVVSPVSDPQALEVLERVLLTLGDTPEGRALLKEAFDADAIEPAPRLGYRALYRVALSTL